MIDEDGRGGLLPGSHNCVGCHGLTFRRSDDMLCPRCAFDAETLIERIELDGLERDLQLITQFDAYYRSREESRKRLKRVAAGPLFGRRPVIDPVSREPIHLEHDAFWSTLRDAG